MSNEGLWEQLEKLDCANTAQRAKCEYLSDEECYIIQFLNTEYIVDFSDKKIYSIQEDSPPKPVTFLEELCLLAYLINAKDLPLANKLVKSETLPGGQFFFRGLHSLATDKLEKAFGDCPEGLYRIAQQFGGERCEFGDASIQLHMLPRIPLTIVIWRRCEEFDARASILFDQTAAAQLPLDALWAAANFAIKTLVKTAPGNG